MDVGILLQLLTSLQILSHLVSPADPLLTPMVFADPQHPVYFPGERLSLRCLAPPWEVVSSYQFYNQRGERVFTEIPEPAGGAWLVMTTETGKAGAYSCEYWAVRDGQHLYSGRSQPVQVPVMDFPLAPSISAVSGPSRNGPVTILCLAPQGYTASRYQFVRQGKVIVSQPDARFQLRNSDWDAASTYACSYEVTVSGRRIQSLPSAPISIHQPGPPVLPEAFRPTLRLSPVGPRFATGDYVTLTCLAPLWEKKMRFCFLKAGQEVVCTRLVVEDSQSYQIGRLGLEDSGSYTCTYWVAESGEEIASPESQPISVAVTDAPLLPPAPQVVLDPSKRIYVQGERFKLTCSAPDSEQVMGYRFYQQRGERISELDAAWLERTAETGNAWVYFCVYWIVRSGQAILSGKSDPVSITVTVLPLAPTLSLHPQFPMYLHGEKITLSCSAPSGEEKTGYRFHRHRGDQTPEELPGASGGPWLELTAQTGNDAAYTCRYWRWEAGMEIASGDSNGILVQVSDPLPQPVLSIDPPTGAVSEGLPLLITCTALRDAGERMFHFYKDGAEIVPGDAGSQISTMKPGISSMNICVLSIPRAGPNSTGEFTCGYEENMGGRWVPSTRSWAVNVTMNITRIDTWAAGRGLLIAVVAGCSGGGAALGLLVLCCVCRRMKRGSSKTRAGNTGVNGAPEVNIALQPWSLDGRDKQGTHNQRWLPSLLGEKSKKRGKGAEDTGARAGCKSSGAAAVGPPERSWSSMFPQRGGNLVSEEVIYNEPLF